MKKSLFKILSMICAIALICTISSFAVMAEGEFAALTAESLAVSNGVNQLPTSIVSNLTLPEIKGVTWESSNPNVLANDGTVTRPMIEDADVTLTAKSATENKTFSYTVKARTTNVVAQDSFAYADNSAFIANNWYKGWNTSIAETESKIVTETDGNKYGLFGFVSNAGQKRKSISVEADMVYISFDAKPDAALDTTLQVRVPGTKISDGSKATEYTFNLIRFYKGQGRTHVSGGSFSTYDGTRFVHVDTRIDFANKQFYISFDGSEEAGPYSIATQRSGGASNDIFASNDYLYRSIDLIGFVRNASNDVGNICIDNFIISTKTSADEVIASMNAQEQLDYIVGDLKEQLPLTDNAALSAKTIALPTYGGIVSWKDASGTALSESVALTQNETTFNAGKLVATITPTGDGDKTPKTYTYSYSVLPAAMSARTRNTSKAAFSFDDSWEAPTTMNNTAYTEMEFKVFGTTGDPIPENVVWTTELENENEVANRVAKFSNTSGADKTVALTQGGGDQTNRRMQIGADFKLAEGNNVTVAITGPENVVNVPMNFEQGTFTLKERSNDVVKNNNPELTKTYNLADYGVTASAWNRIEIDYSPVGFVYDVYLNGIKVNNIPLNFGCVTGNNNYYANTFRFLTFSIPTGSTLLLDNVTVAETGTDNTGKGKALLDGALRRLDRNFATDNNFYNGESLYNGLNDLIIFPGTPYASANVSTPSINWKLDGVALPEDSDTGLVPLNFTGIGSHTLEATLTCYSISVTKSWTITGAPVALRALDTNIPEVKMGSDVSGKLFVATYSDNSKSVLESVKIYNYANGVNENGAFDYTNDYIGRNVRLFFFDSKLVPLAYSVER